ncbi:MAG: hypothetical protein M0T70_11650 [Geobacteraceae bacterium]|nr:hypothetical protein [Geobacteraceae bacterium]
MLTRRIKRNLPAISAYYKATLVLVLHVVMLFVATHTAMGATSGEVAGISLPGASGVTLTVTELMALESAAAITTPPVPASQPLALSFATQTLGNVNFTAATLADTSLFPPDSMGAAGPAQFVALLNGRIRTFNKATGIADGVLNTSTNTFFDAVRNASDTNSPRIRYDRATQRWFLTIINDSFPNRILIAVSDAASQGVISGTTTFTYFYIDSPSGCSIDYPTLGIDANALYIGANMFCGTDVTTATFSSSDGYVVRKSSILGSGPIVATAFPKLLPDATSEGPVSPQGVDNFDSTANEGYFIGTSNTLFGELVLRRVSNPATTPTISPNILIPVDLTSAPLSVPHLGNSGGTSGNLDALDDRLVVATLRNGRLWTAHNIAVNSAGSADATTLPLDRNGSRWYELQGIATGQTPSVVQSGTVFDSATSNPRFYWIPSIMVSGQGHAAMGFSTAGATEYINAGTAGRLAGDPLGTMGNPLLYTSSSSAYNPPGDTGIPNGSRRWGNYSYTSVDPNDDMTIWTIQEFCDATDSYGVRVAKLLAPPPATPSAALPATVSLNQSAVDVTITGASISGSGFFDPGTGFSNHISASVTGGVTVNSVTYTDPTHITLNISTIGATPGDQTVSVTNPDGQNIASATALISIPPPYPLNLTLTGNGGGSVTITNQGNQTVCNTTCSAQIPGGTAVTLHASADQYSLFSGWSDACSGLSDCTITMNSATGVTAPFAIDTAHSVLSNSVNYSSILAAYQAADPAAPAPNGTIIETWGISFPEALSFNLGKIITLRGGYNSTFTSKSGRTTITAPLKISNGLLIMDNIAVK